MAYSPEDKENIFNHVFSEIEKGRALRNVIKDDNMPDITTFYSWIESDESKAKQYTRACEVRAEAIFEDILVICDATEDDIIFDEDGKPITNHNVIQRDRLRVDSRKWILSKLNPKKYGDRMQHANDPDNPLTQMVDLSKIPTSVLIELENAGIKTE